VLHWFHKRLEANVKKPRENRCFQTVIVFSFGSFDNSNKCTVLWKIAARLITVSTSVNNEMWVKLSPQIRACTSRAPGSSSHEFATRAIRRRYVDMVQVTMSLPISLQRLMRRHPLPLTGFLGLVPPLQRYYEVLRLPAAPFAALRFLRLAIPSLRPLFVPPGPGRGAVDQSGVGRRYLQPPCSMETTGSPKFPEEPL